MKGVNSFGALDFHRISESTFPLALLSKCVIEDGEEKNVKVTVSRSRDSRVTINRIKTSSSHHAHGDSFNRQRSH